MGGAAAGNATSKSGYAAETAEADFEQVNIIQRSPLTVTPSVHGKSVTVSRLSL